MPDDAHHDDPHRDDAHRDEQRTLASGIRVAGAGSGANIVLGVASALVVSRLYGPVVLGQFTLAYAAVALVSQLSSISERAALVRVLALKEPRSEDGSGLALATFAMSVAITIAVAAVVAVGSTLFLSHAADQPTVVGPMLALVAGYVVFDNTAWNLEGVLSAHRAAGALVAGRLVYSVVLFACSVLFAMVDRGVWALAAASLVASVAAVASRVHDVRPYLAFRVPRAAFVEGVRQLPDIARFGLRVLPGSLAHGLTNQVSTWVMGAIAPIATVGAFARAQSITVRLSDVNYRLASVLYPSFVREADRGHERAFVAIVVRTLRTTFAPFLVATCAAAGASHTILLLFGEGFVAAQGALALLLLAGAAALGDMIVGEALTAKGRPHLASIGSVAGMVVVVAGVVPLTKTFGATGAGAAMLAGTTVALATHTWSLVRITSTGGWRDHHLVRGALALVGTSAVAFGVVYAVQELLGSAAVVALGGVTAAVVGAALLRRRHRVAGVGASSPHPM
jgi:O-antigen/teichoic acid export membrane protein